MTITILFACSILAVSILTWIFRKRFAKHLPSKEAVSTFCLVAPVVVLLIIAVLPDILFLVSTINLMPPIIRSVLGLAAAATIMYAGCSKQPETPRQPAIQWSAPETGYRAETPIPKEGQ